MRNPMYGGYNSMYGGLGGMGGMYGGIRQPGMMGVEPNDPNSLTNSFSQSTQATFQMIESIVSAFQGVAQMLESTYMATHSSFFGEHYFKAFLSVTDLHAQPWYPLRSNSPTSEIRLDRFLAYLLSSAGYELYSLK
jgi:hypothetical protein